MRPQDTQAVMDRARLLSQICQAATEKRAWGTHEVKDSKTTLQNDLLQLDANLISKATDQLPACWMPRPVSQSLLPGLPFLGLLQLKEPLPTAARRCIELEVRKAVGPQVLK